MSLANCMQGYFQKCEALKPLSCCIWRWTSAIKRKSFPAIAKAVGLEHQQNLHHFLSQSPWTVQQLRQQRLELLLQVLNGQSLILLIEETGDCKKGKSTDYVKRQYMGTVGKKENGIVAVTAYGFG